MSSSATSTRTPPPSRISRSGPVAFPGTGELAVPTENPEAGNLLRGSARRALGVTDRKFDRLLLVEEDRQRCQELEALCEQHPDREIQVRNENANVALPNFANSLDWSCWRGVVFLDPFGARVDWATIQAIGQTNALDTWILFPVSAIQRLLPRFRKPDEISAKWATRLDRIYWRVRLA